MNIPDHHDPRFDARLRQLHGEALSSLSPATLARLRAARQGATAAQGARARHRGAWWLATACSAVLAVALGVQLNALLNPRAPMTAAPAATATATATANGDELFEQNPDLYVWLASDGALAMEQTR